MKEKISEKTHKKLTWIASAFSLTFPAVFCFLLVLAMAYINPSKSVIVYINEYGEATLELIAFSIMALINFISLTYFWIFLFKTRK